MRLADDGGELAADVVLLGTGVAPRTCPFAELEVAQVPVEERPPLRELPDHPHRSAMRASRGVLEPFGGPR